MTLSHDSLCPLHYGTELPCSQWCLPLRITARHAADDLAVYFQSFDRRLYEARLQQRLARERPLAVV
jgi:hypothetical protein